jgi:hypothetical protein
MGWRYHFHVFDFCLMSLCVCACACCSVELVEGRLERLESDMGDRLGRIEQLLQSLAADKAR